MKKINEQKKLLIRVMTYLDSINIKYFKDEETKKIILVLNDKDIGYFESNKETKFMELILFHKNTYNLLTKKFPIISNFIWLYDDENETKLIRTPSYLSLN